MRVPRFLPYLIRLGEHHAEDGTVIALDDLAVTADADEIALVRISTGQRVRLCRDRGRPVRAGRGAPA